VRLIDDLLDVSRISRGMLELKKERADLAAIVEHALEAVRPFLDRRRQQVAAELRGPVHAVVDPTRVAQIVGNLFHNASKYTPLGGSFSVELSAAGDAATIRVVDTGAGIPVDQLDRVFDMFARIDRAVPQQGGGLGIGLALARRLAEMHGGGLRASSAGEGQGATFTLTLPTEPSVRPAAAEAAEVGGGALAAGDVLEIVVIEDNDDSAETLALWLEEMGHRVQVARTGPDGVALVRSVRPHVVLCDIGLPDMDGVEVCRRVRAFALEPAPLMVALTGWGMTEDRRRTGEAGFEHHLVKPVLPDKLREILRAATGAKR
jgi:two-component system CheB/CheR fusion protein